MNGFVNRIKNLSLYQKGVLIVMLVMALVFTVFYPMTISRVGFEYKDTILVPKQEETRTVYTGKIQGEHAQFTVSKDGTVVFHHGDTLYGPYTVKLDATAIPKNSELSGIMKGVEIRQEEEILFRGGYAEVADIPFLYNEDGTVEGIGLTVINGVQYDENGNKIDPMKPSLYTLVELTLNPELTHKGDWAIWFFGIILCIITAVSILFVDELFQFEMAFHIRNVDRLEPSEWELAGRYLSWTFLPILTLVIFIMGLE